MIPAVSKALLPEARVPSPGSRLWLAGLPECPRPASEPRADAGAGLQESLGEAFFGPPAIHSFKKKGMGRKVSCPGPEPLII